MALSAIAGVTIEGAPVELGSFIRNGVVYVVWNSLIPAPSLRRLNWKPHNALDFTEVFTQAATFRNVTVIYDPVADDLLAIWDDGLGEDGVRNGTLYSARFNVLTGEYTVEPAPLFPGTNPRLGYLTRTIDQRFLLYYRTPRSYGVYGRVSDTGGAVWESAYPLITGKVSGTQAVEVVPYDDSRVSVAQLGVEARPLQELTTFKRTRPLSSILRHPSDATKLFVAEPSRLNDTTVTDYLRGRLTLSTDNSVLYHTDGVVAGTSDGINAVALLTLANDTLTVSASAGPNGNGDDVAAYTLVPAFVSASEMPGSTGVLVDFDVSATYGYAALYADSSGTAGELVVVTLSTMTPTSALSGIGAVRAVSVANFLATPRVFVATFESSVNRLRVYDENGTSPTLLSNVPLPARVNGVLATAHPTNATAVRLIVSMVDRVGVYDYFGAGAPVILHDAVTPTMALYGAQSFKVVRTPSGKLVVPLGNGGVAVYDEELRLKAMTKVSGLVVNTWVPGTAYSINTLIRPRATHEFAPARYYFKATVGGTASNAEPRWTSSGNVSDGTVTWVAQGLTDGVVTDVAVDEGTKRVYAVGVAGGNMGTEGRVWVIDARGVL
jgi:hypothetical protein